MEEEGTDRKTVERKVPEGKADKTGSRWSLSGLPSPVRRLLPSKGTTYVSLISSTISVVLAAFAYIKARATQHDIASDEFNTATVTAFTQLEARIILSLSPAELCTSYLISNSSINRSSFKRFVSDSPSFFRNSSLQAIAFAPRVLGPSQRAAWEAEGLDYISSFKFTERDSSNTLITAAIRPEYFPVQWIEPYVGNEPALGYDLYSNPTRKRAIDVVKARGVPTMTERITLVQSTKSQFGSLYFIPFFYANDSSVGTPIGASGPTPLRTVNFTGTAYLGGFSSAVFKLDEVVTSALKSLTLADVDVFLFDCTPLLNSDTPAISGLSAPTNSFLGAFIRISGNVSSPYATTNFTEFSTLTLENVQSDMIRTKNLTVGDRIWTIAVAARPGFFAFRSSQLPLLFLVCSLLEPAAFWTFLFILVTWELKKLNWEQDIKAPIARRITLPSRISRQSSAIATGGRGDSTVDRGKTSGTLNGSKNNSLARKKLADGTLGVPGPTEVTMSAPMLDAVQDNSAI
ncbi:hypothetical protein HDU93_007471 [Gonapodya sp. JEL0774]|nr:hypothetical protein HDU93_007471 [Gonapodya sp. JEL0774]